jgi:hypothetical protein
MNIDRLINMILNRIIRIVVNKGVDGAVNAATGQKKRRC